MKRAYFVTGTDTGVGKTTVTAGIIASLRRRGHSVAALKPIETGCAGDLPHDGLRLARALGLPDGEAKRIAPIRYATPVAPAVAARIEQAKHDSVTLETHIKSVLATRADAVFIEGAGGLLVPFTDDLLAADIASRHDLPLIVIARASLGTINHTLLTLNEARRRHLRVRGVILNRVTPDVGPDEASNAAEIERLGQVRVLGTVQHRPGGDVDVDDAFDPTVLLTEA